MCVSGHLPVTRLHCLVDVRDAPENFDFFSFAEDHVACCGEREADSYPEEFECEQTAGDQNYERSRVRQDVQNGHLARPQRTTPL